MPPCPEEPLRSLLLRSAVAASLLAATLAAPAAFAQAPDVDAARDEVQELGREVEAAAAEYDAVLARLDASQARADAAEARAAGQAEAIADIQAELAALAVETFKRGGVDPQLGALLGSRSSDARATSTLTLLAERRSVSLDDLEQAQVELRQTRAAFAAELDEVVALKADLDSRRIDIEARLDGARDVLAVAQADEAERLAAEEERRRQQVSRSNADGSSSGVFGSDGSAVDGSSSDEATGSIPAQRASGGLIVPVQGRPTSPFGYRIHPVTGENKLHSGADWSAPCGTPVVAAADGVIESARYEGSYGNYTVIQHGGGLSTAYAHLSGFEVTGGSVSQGQVIGYVGVTGLSTGCHLHFMVLESGQPQNPAGYL